MALNVDQNVAVVSVLNLEDVAQQGISSQRLTEVGSGHFELVLLLTSELTLEVVNDPGVFAHLLFDAVYA